MKFKILYESHDDKGTYGFLTKSSFSEFKKVTKKLVALLDKYDKVIDELEAKADSEGTQELLEKNAYYNSLIKAYSNSYETILSLDNAFKNNYIKVDTFHPSDEVVVDLSIYKVDDLYDLLYDLQDTLSKSNNLDEGLNTNMKFLVENELEKRHKKHKKTIKPGAMGSFIHPDGGNQVAIDTFNNSVDMGNVSSSSSLGEDWRALKKSIDWNKVQDLLSFIFDDNQPVSQYCDFKYKEKYLLCGTILDGFRDANKESPKRDDNEEKQIRARAKQKGVYCRISEVYHRNRFDVIVGLECQLRVPYSLITKDESLNEDYVEDKLNRLISVQHFISPKDDIQLFTTEKGNYLVKRNGKQMMILDKKNFRESEIEDLRLNGYFRDYDKMRMNESLNEDTNFSSNEKNIIDLIYNIWLNNEKRHLSLKELRAKANNELNTLSDLQIRKLINDYDFSDKLCKLRCSNKEISCSISDYKKLCLDQNRIEFTAGEPREDISIDFDDIPSYLQSVSKKHLKSNEYFIFGHYPINLEYKGCRIGGFSSIIYPAQLGSTLGCVINKKQCQEANLDISKLPPILDLPFYSFGFYKDEQGTINESLKEDTIKQNGKWVNKGKEGTHGKFDTKKEADAQRKAMFANGYKESLQEEVEEDNMNSIKEKVIKAIQDEWKTIAYYNDLIEELKKIDDLDGINVINDINNEEHIHVGQLQSLLQTMGGDIEAIHQGNEEGDEQLTESLKEQEDKINDFIEASRGYSDYNQIVEDVADEFDLSKEDAEQYVWNYMYTIGHDVNNIYDESLNEDEPLYALRNFKKHAEYGDSIKLDVNGEKVVIQKEYSGWYLTCSKTRIKGPYKHIEAVVKDLANGRFDQIYDSLDEDVPGGQYYWPGSEEEWESEEDIYGDEEIPFDDSLEKSCDMKESRMTNKEIKEALNKLDMWAIDNDTTFYDLKTLYEAFVNPNSPVDQKKKEKIQKALNDPTLNKDKEKLQDYISGVLMRQEESLEETLEDEDDFNNFKSANKNHNKAFDNKKFGKYFDKNGHLIPEKAKEYWAEFNKPLTEGVKQVIIPKPYDEYFEVDTINVSDDDFYDYKPGDEIDGYDCHFIAYLIPKTEEVEDIYPVLTDDPKYPVCELIADRLIPVDLPEDL